MPRISTTKSHWSALWLGLAVFFAFFLILSRATAHAAPPVKLKDQDGCEYRLTKEDQSKNYHLYRLDQKTEKTPHEMSLRILGEDGQPEEVRMQAVPKSGRDGFAEYEGVSNSGMESFVGVELRISFGPGEKVHVLRPVD